MFWKKHVTRNEFDYEIKNLRREFQEKFDEARFYKESPDTQYGNLDDAIFTREAIRAIVDYFKLEYQLEPPTEKRVNGNIILVKKK